MLPQRYPIRLRPVEQLKALGLSCYVYLTSSQSRARDFRFLDPMGTRSRGCGTLSVMRGQFQWQ